MKKGKTKPLKERKELILPLQNSNKLRGEVKRIKLNQKPSKVFSLYGEIRTGFKPSIEEE